MRTNTIKLDYKKSTQIVAHRGCSGLERENTAAAFIAAGNRSYFGVETDIYHTVDGQYICHHDGSTGRICEVDLPIQESTFEALRALNLTDVDGATDRAEIRLATPYEYLKICKKYQKHCVPELKSNFTLEEMKEIMDIFAAENYLDDTCFIAFNIENLDLVKKIRPEQECQFLTSKWDDSLPAMLAERNMGLDIHYAQLNEERIKALHEAGVQVNCWTVDDPEKARELIEWGVDYITSNILE